MKITKQVAKLKSHDSVIGSGQNKGEKTRGHYVPPPPVVSLCSSPTWIQMLTAFPHLLFSASVVSLPGFECQVLIKFCF